MTPASKPGAATVKVDRYGYKINGDFFPRVTSFVGMLPKPWLGAWAAKMVAQKAVDDPSWRKLSRETAVKKLKGAPWEKRDAAGDRGSAVHKAIECYLNDAPLPDGLTEDELDCAIAAESFLRDFEVEVRATEVTVFSERYNYAGTLDVWAEVGTDLEIDDWKTGKGAYADAALQLASYRMAEYAVVNDEIIEWGPHRARHLNVIHIQPGSYPKGYGIYPVAMDPDEAFRMFRALKFIKEEWVNLYEGGGPGRVAKRAALGEPYPCAPTPTKEK
jgi:hypothetical protein